jgi:hypothetical protein
MAAMQPRWVRWTVIVLAVLLALSLALYAVPSDASAQPHASGSSAPARVVRPPVDAPADYQLGGDYPPAGGVRVVVRDRLARPAGRYDVCYVNAFQPQPGELGWWRAHHPGLLLRRAGRLVRDPGWPDEVLLDTSTPARRRGLAAVLGRWATRCAEDGFDAVEPDNLDSWQRSHGRLTRPGNLDLARRLVAVAHGRGLAVAQKNTAELTRAEVTRTGFDFAVAEDCAAYDECGRYERLYGDHVLEVEYADNGRGGFDAACVARGARWSIVYRDRDLLPAGQRGHVRAAC